MGSTALTKHDARACDRCGEIATVAASDAVVCDGCISRFRYSTFMRPAQWWRFSPLEIRRCNPLELVSVVLAAVAIIIAGRPSSPVAATLLVFLGTVAALLWLLRVFGQWRRERRDRKLDQQLMSKLQKRRVQRSQAASKVPTSRRGRWLTARRSRDGKGRAKDGRILLTDDGTNAGVYQARGEVRTGSVDSAE